jgi:hypothetical protein
MKSLWNPQLHGDVVARVARLTPDTRPQWGRMTCPQMVVHITDAFGMYCGDIPVGFKRTPIQYFPIKHAFLYLLPMPKNVPTARELKSRVPGEWDFEMERLRKAISQFADQRTRTDWPLHPIFGRMSARAYGVLAYKHTNHHLRQFGV